MLFRILYGRCVVCFVFDQSIAASDNRLSYACILLFPKSTKYLLGSPICSSEWQSTLYGTLQAFVCWKVIAQSTYFLYVILCNALYVIARSCLLWKTLQKRLKCLCGIQNKPNKHYTVLKLIIFIHTLLNSGHRTISP